MSGTPAPAGRPGGGLIRMLAAGAALLIAATDAAGQSGRAGWYVGLEAGVSVPRDIDLRGTSDDVPTNCDGHFPAVEIDGRTLPLPLHHSECNRSAEGWASRFGIGRGSLLGAQAGYVWRALRLEAEYVRRRHGGERSASSVTAGDKEAEFVHAVERLSGIEADAFFANVYYEFRGLPGGLTSYVGAGVGLVAARADYAAAYRRNPDSGVLRALGRHPAAAGTLSGQEAALSDRLRAYQFLIGVDRPLAGFVVGARVRRVGVLDDFADGGPPDVLRGHAPTVAPGGRTVVNTVATRDLGYWAISLDLKRFF